jgi:hypothetical protein
LTGDLIFLYYIFIRNQIEKAERRESREAMRLGSWERGQILDFEKIICNKNCVFTIILAITTDHCLSFAMLFMQHRGLANCRG